MKWGGNSTITRGQPSQEHGGNTYCFATKADSLQDTGYNMCSPLALSGLRGLASGCLYVPYLAHGLCSAHLCSNFSARPYIPAGSP